MLDPSSYSGSYGGTMFSRVLACTLLHRELWDYSLGQIAFAVFRALFAITQLLCHVLHKRLLKDY